MYNSSSDKSLFFSSQSANESSKEPKSAAIENGKKKDYMNGSGHDPLEVEGICELKHTIDQQKR